MGTTWSSGSGRGPWSNGKVAMIGASYEGTTANAAAVERPPHLATIVPIAAIDRWYDYAYMNGVRWFLNDEAYKPAKQLPATGVGRVWWAWALLAGAGALAIAPRLARRRV